MPTLGQVWSLSEGGGSCKGSVRAGRWCDVDSGTLGTGDNLVRVLNAMSDCQFGYCLCSNVRGKSSVSCFGLGG